MNYLIFIGGTVKNNFTVFRYVIGIISLSFILSFRLVSGQTSGLVTTNDNLNRLTLTNGTRTISSVPVTSPSSRIMSDQSAGNIQNVQIAGWTLLQTVSGVVKAISFVNPTVGYMAAELGVVYKTTNGGADWSTVLNLGFPYYWYGVHTFTPQKVLIAGFNNTTGDGIMRWTYDGGVNWTDDIIVAPAPFNWLQGLGFADSLHGLAVGSILSAGKVFITANGGTDSTDWIPVTADPTQGWFAGNFTMKPDGKYYITGISFCNSSDFGLSWARRTSIDNTFDGGVSFPDDLHGWTGGGSISPTVEGWVHRTTDGGITWSGRILSTPYPVRVVYFFDSQVGIAQGGEVNSGIGGIWESIDGGVNWTEAVSTGMEMGSIDWQRISADSIDIWSVGYTSSGGFHSGVFKKRIGFNVVPVELTSFNALVNYEKVILKWETATETNNKGFEIQRINNGNTFRDIAFIQGNGTTTQKHSYSFSDNEVSAGNYSYRLKQIDYDGSYHYSSIASAEVIGINQFAVYQNYPNPFNPTTMINYYIPVSGNVQLKIYNVLSQEVAILVNGYQGTGNHSIEFDAGKLTSGIYFYKLQAKGVDGSAFTSTRKMMLMK